MVGEKMEGRHGRVCFDYSRRPRERGIDEKKTTFERNTINSPSQEQVPNTGTREVECRTRSESLQDLKVDQVQKTPHQLLLRCRNVIPKWMVGFDNLEPFCFCFFPVFGEPVVEEDFDGGLFAVIVVGVVWNETDEAT